MQRATIQGLIAALLSTVLSGCYSYYSFGVLKRFPNTADVKYIVKSVISPREYRGEGVARKAELSVGVWNEQRNGKNVLWYNRTIMASMVDIDAKMRSHLLSITVQDQSDHTKKWLLLFTESKDGEFHLMREEGAFLK